MFLLHAVPALEQALFLALLMSDLTSNITCLLTLAAYLDSLGFLVILLLSLGFVLVCLSSVFGLINCSGITAAFIAYQLLDISTILTTSALSSQCLIHLFLRRHNNYSLTGVCLFLGYSFSLSSTCLSLLYELLTYYYV